MLEDETLTLESKEWHINNGVDKVVDGCKKYLDQEGGNYPLKR